MEDTLLKLKLISLTPVKLLHIWSDRLRKSQLGEFIFTMAGVILSLAIIGYGYYPFNSKWKFVLGFFYVTLIFSFEIVQLITVWEKLQTFIFNISMVGNIKYNKCRDILRKKSNNYSMGFDEGAEVTINYFIKKNKKEKKMVYIHK